MLPAELFDHQEWLRLEELSSRGEDDLRFLIDLLATEVKRCNELDEENDILQTEVDALEERLQGQPPAEPNLSSPLAVVTPPVKSGPKRFGSADKEKEIVQQIKTWHTAGKSLRQIAAKLNERGIGTRRGKRWSAQQVKNALSHAA